MLRFLGNSVVAAAIVVSISACNGATALAPSGGAFKTALSEPASSTALLHIEVPDQVIGTGMNGQRPQVLDNLLYHNGLVQTFPAIGLVYWGFHRPNADPDNEIPRLDSFLLHLRGSSSLNVPTQYYEIFNGQKVYVPNYPAMSIAVWKDDVNPLPSPHPIDRDVRAEALRAASYFNFGVPLVDNLIIVAIPHGVPMRYAECAYHGTVNGITYTNLPYQADFGAPCGAYSVNPGPVGVLDGVTETAIHEIAESMTDPHFFGWYDAKGLEIGDKCQQFAKNVVLHGKKFPVQPLWSNATGDCRYDD